jgi:hypothetical protein
MTMKQVLSLAIAFARTPTEDSKTFLTTTEFTDKDRRFVQQRYKEILIEIAGAAGRDTILLEELPDSFEKKRVVSTIN